MNKLTSKICLVVIGENLKTFLKNLAEAQRQADLLELRADYIKDLKIQDLEIIKNKLTKKAIFTCREKKEGGKFLGAEIDRINILEQALKLGFDFVDLELSAIKKINLKLKAKNTKIICSYHNFKTTPNFKKLKEIKEKAKKAKCDIIKIASQVNKKSDLANLLELLIHKKAQEELIIIGMGEKGEISRIIGPLFGSLLTFASGKETTAPGQLNIQELKKLYFLLDKRFKN